MQKGSLGLCICAPVGLHPLKRGIVGDEMEKASPMPLHVVSPLLLMDVGQRSEADEDYLAARFQQPCCEFAGKGPDTTDRICGHQNTHSSSASEWGFCSWISLKPLSAKSCR